MKATLSFDLPEEATEHRNAVRGGDYLCAIEEIVMELRNRAKHGKPEATGAAELAAIRGMITEVLDDRGIDPNA